MLHGRDEPARRRQRERRLRLCERGDLMGDRTVRTEVGQEVVDALLKGEKVEISETRSVGCQIKWR